MANINRHGSTWHDDKNGGFPARFRRIKMRVAAQDAAWFTAHPGEAHYVRPYVPGEFWPGIPPSGIEVIVLVAQMAPGLRTRQALAHVVRSPVDRIDVIDPSSGSVLFDVPMEGWSNA